MVDGTPCEDHSLRIRIGNFRPRDDHGNHNKNQTYGMDVSQNLEPEARANNGDVLRQNKFSKFYKQKCWLIITEMLK